MAETIKYPTYKKLAKELVGSADVGPIDVLSALANLIIGERAELDDGDSKPEIASRRELRMIAIEDRLRSGAGYFDADLFGIKVRVSRLFDIETEVATGEIPDPDDGGDLDGDREPRVPVEPTLPSAGDQRIPENV